MPGCPAQVGIHRSRKLLAPSCKWLPRARGYTFKAQKSRFGIRAAPRKWGYTLEDYDPNTPGDGCPAQVGIHPLGPRGPRGRRGLPRASGDTPAEWRLEGCLKQAAPRKWGYTGTCRNQSLAPHGCPAQVGIHLDLWIWGSQLERLPRASGDTPGSDSGSLGQYMAAPRKWGYTYRVLCTGTRGWGYTLLGEDVAACLAGCPAQVGIHRRHRMPKCDRQGLPRASGDTPTALFTKLGQTGAAPRKWGYTAGTDGTPSCHHGCPAQVGIHPV